MNKVIIQFSNKEIISSHLPVLGREHIPNGSHELVISTDTPRVN